MLYSGEFTLLLLLSVHTIDYLKRVDVPATVDDVVVDTRIRYTIC